MMSAAREQLGQVDVARAERPHALVGERVVGQHDRSRSRRGCAAAVAPMMPGADHPDRAAAQVEAEQAVEREVAVAHALVGAVDLAVESQDQGDGVLGDGVRRVGRDAHDAQAERRRRGEIDVVEAGRAQRDQPGAAVGQHGQRGGVERVVHERADRREPGGERRGLRGQARLEEDELMAEPARWPRLRNSRSYWRVEKTAMRVADLACFGAIPRWQQFPRPCRANAPRAHGAG